MAEQNMWKWTRKGTEIKDEKNEEKILKILKLCKNFI